MPISGVDWVYIRLVVGFLFLKMSHHRPVLVAFIFEISCFDVVVCLMLFLEFFHFCKCHDVMLGCFRRDALCFWHDIMSSTMLLQLSSTLLPPPLGAVIRNKNPSHIFEMKQPTTNRLKT